jgi:hypothetical protein
VANAGHIAPSSSGRARNEYELGPTRWSGAECALRRRSVTLAIRGASLTARGCRLPGSGRLPKAAAPGFAARWNAGASTLSDTPLPIKMR